MCLVFFYINPDFEKAPANHVRFAMLFNREELWSRQTIPLEPFEEDHNIYAGRDKAEGGTWLGVNKQTGNLCFLTNRFLFKNLISQAFSWPSLVSRPISRGNVLKPYLETNFIEKALLKDKNKIHEKQLDYVNDIFSKYSLFGSCQCIYGNLKNMKFYHLCNVEQDPPKEVEPGYHTLCSYNHFQGKKLQKEEIGIHVFKKIIESYHTEVDKNKNYDIDKVFESMWKLGKDKQPRQRNLFKLMVDKESSIFLPKYQSKLRKNERGTKSVSCYLFLNNGLSYVREHSIDHNDQELYRSHHLKMSY